MFAKMDKKSDSKKKIIMSSFKSDWLKLVKASTITKIDQPMIAVGQGAYNFDDELNLVNPYTPIVCFIMYLYSMEFGTPPLYAEINRVARNMDLSELETLGPIIHALSAITCGAEG